jgi:hypothetical protein
MLSHALGGEDGIALSAGTRLHQTDSIHMSITMQNSMKIGIPAHQGAPIKHKIGVPITILNALFKMNSFIC